MNLPNSIILSVTDGIRERSYDNPNTFVESLLELGFILFVVYFVILFVRGLIADRAAGGPELRRENRRVQEQDDAARKKEHDRRTNNPEPEEAKLELVTKKIDLDYLYRQLAHVKNVYGSVAKAPNVIKNGLQYQEKKLPQTKSRIASLETLVAQYESRHGPILANSVVTRAYLWACQYRGRTSSELWRHRQHCSRSDHVGCTAYEEARKAYDKADAIRVAFLIQDDPIPPFDFLN